MANEKQTIVYSYEEINQDMNTNEELRNLLNKWIESEPSELRTRMIKELNEEIGNN
jgi:hypothetical protein